MIVDFQRFLKAGRPVWEELEEQLNRAEAPGNSGLTYEEALRLHELYEQTCSDLGRLHALPGEHELRDYLEGLVGRGYQFIHEPPRGTTRIHPLRWFFGSFPRAFRRRSRYFMAAMLCMFLGAAVGGALIKVDPANRRLLFPPQFGHLYDTPTERVEREMQAQRGNVDVMAGGRSTFSAQLMTHNTRVTIFTLALGMLFGIPTLILLFYNGVILGAVCVDYIVDGQGVFLAGWLLPHGSVEIPAILLGGQAGLMIGAAVLGLGRTDRWRARLRDILPDTVHLIGGAAVLLVWAGLVEAFFSQYHEPVLPYSIKIAFGSTQLVLLVVFLWRSGRRDETDGEEDHA